MIFISDMDSGALWGPTAHVHQAPQGTYVARHGFGYSRFEHTAAGIESRLIQFVPGDDPREGLGPHAQEHGLAGSGGFR